MDILNTSFLFLIFRKTVAVIQIISASANLFIITVNAETWYFGQKFNGMDAYALMVPANVFGIVGACLFWKKTKAYPLVVIWFIYYFSLLVGNRLY